LAAQDKPNLLILSSTFPRWPGDKEPPFVYDLSNRLTDQYSCTVLAPHAPHAKKRESIGNLDIVRYRYLPEKLQRLAYDGGIMPKLKQNKWLLLQVPFLLTSQLFSTMRLLKNKPFTLIHAHWVIPQGLIAVLARKLTGKHIPILCTLHGGDLFSLQGSWFNKLKTYTLKHVDGITVVSQAMKTQLIEQGINPSRIEVIPMGVDLINRFKPTTGQKRAPNSILFVGRLVDKKGIKYLLEAMPEILKSYPDTKCHIVGAGPEEKPLKALVKKSNIEHSVCFHGPCGNHELPALFHKYSVVAFPSIITEDGDQEGFGLVLVEALGCECPVVSSDLPAIHDIVHHNKTGIIVKPEDPVALATAIQKLLSDKKLAENIGKAGRQHVLQYDWNNIASRYIKYINLFSARNP